MVKLKYNGNAKSVIIKGQQYPVISGHILVNDNVALLLTALHGFEKATTEQKKPRRKPTEKKPSTEVGNKPDTVDNTSDDK